MSKKYEFTGETNQWAGHTLHRIRACVSFENVQAGDLGGWIEKEANLSQEGLAWVYDDACIFDDAKVYSNAYVFGNARVYGNAEVCDNAFVCGNARVYGNTKVCDNARVYGGARVYGDAYVFGNAEVCGNARVYGNTKVCDNACVFGNAEVCDNARVYGGARVYGNAEVCGNADINRCSHFLCVGPIGSRNGTTTFFKTRDCKIYVKCSCFSGDLEQFATEAKKTHGDNKYAQAYMAAIALAKAQIDLT